MKLLQPDLASPPLAMRSSTPTVALKQPGGHSIRSLERTSATARLLDAGSSLTTEAIEHIPKGTC